MVEYNAVLTTLMLYEPDPTDGSGWVVVSDGATWTTGDLLPYFDQSHGSYFEFSGSAKRITIDTYGKEDDEPYALAAEETLKLLLFIGNPAVYEKLRKLFKTYGFGADKFLKLKFYETANAVETKHLNYSHSNRTGKDGTYFYCHLVGYQISSANRRTGKRTVLLNFVGTQSTL